MRAISGAHGALIAVAAGLAIAGLSAPADGVSIYLVTDLGNLVPLQPEWEPQLPDHVGLTPYIHVEPPPNAMIAVGHETSGLYLFRPASAGITGIPPGADVRLITKAAWDAGDVYTFRGEPVGDIRNVGPSNGLYGLPYIQGSYTNMFPTTTVDADRFTASGSPSNEGPRVDIDTAAGHNYLEIGSGTKSRAIVATADVDFTTYTGNTATFHIYRSCHDACSNFVTIGTHPTDLLGAVSASSGWATSGRDTIAKTVTQEADTDRTHGGNSMTYEYTLPVPPTRDPGTDLRPTGVPTDVSHSDSVWTSKGRHGELNGVTVSGSYYTGGATETHYDSRIRYLHTTTTPVYISTCTITYFGGHTVTYDGPCSSHDCTGLVICTDGTRTTYTTNTEYKYTGWLDHNPDTASTPCAGIDVNSYCTSSSRSNCSCHDTRSLCAQTVAPVLDTCTDSSPTIKALHYGAGTTDNDFVFRITPSACNSGTFPTYNACSSESGHVEFNNFDYTKTTQYYELDNPMDIPPGYSTYTVNGGTNTMPLYLMIDCYENDCKGEEMYVFASDDIPTQPSGSPFDVRLSIQPNLGGNTAILYDDDRHYAVWDGPVDFDAAELAAIGLEADLLLAGSPTVDGAGLHLTKLVSHSSGLSEDPTSPRIFPGYGNPGGGLAIRTLDALVGQPGQAADMRHGGVLLPVGGGYFGTQRIYVAVPFEEHATVKNVLTVPDFDPAWLSCLCLGTPWDYEVMAKSTVHMHRDGLSRSGVDILPGQTIYGPDAEPVMYVPVLPGTEWVLFQADDDWRWYRISALGQPDTGYSQGDTRITFINGSFHDADPAATLFRSDETLLTGQVAAGRDGDLVVDVLTSLAASWSSAVVSQTDETTAADIERELGAHISDPAADVTNPAADAYWQAHGDLVVEPYVVVSAGHALTGTAADCALTGVYCVHLSDIRGPVWYPGSANTRDTTMQEERRDNSVGDGTGKQVRWFGSISYTTDWVVMPATVRIPGAEAGDIMTVELRAAAIRVPPSDGSYAGGPVLSERIIVDIHVGAFGLTAR